MRFAAALSVLPDFQLEVEANYFFALTTPVFEPHVSV